MKEIKYYVNLTDEEYQMINESLFNKRNALLQKGRYTDAVDDLIIKMRKAKKKSFKIKSA